MIYWYRHITSLLIAAVLVLSLSDMSSADYQFIQLSSAEWNSTKADRLQTEVSGSYQFDYGDEATVSFTLPWNFLFYAINYSQITADNDGNIWFGSVGSGPRIAAWNADLDSYYPGGVFIEHKTAPERVVVQWLTETVESAGYGRINSFEAVLLQDGTIQLNYQTISPFASEDSGSGITDGTAWLYLPADVPTLSGTSFELSESDSDGDGVLDTVDNCPNTSNPDQADNDTDGIGDLCDGDDDNDSILDVDDNCPLIDNADQLDFDTDGQGDVCDADDDNDGVDDLFDPFPFDPTEWADNDNDGIGDNSDSDDDNDLLPDSWELTYGLDPFDAADATLDGDLDGLDNLAEFNAGTDPTNDDTDADSLLDGSDNYPTIAAVATLSQSGTLASDSTEILLELDSFVTSGGSVNVEQIADLDADGAVDTGEPVIRRLQLVDTDADGSVSITVNMLNTLAIDHAPCSYLFRANDGSNTLLTPFVVDPVSQPQTLEGRITDGVNGLVGVKVQLVDKWQQPVAWALTDGNGDYLFQVPDAGEFYILPQADGYVFDRDTKSLVTVTASAAATAADVEMVAGVNVVSGNVNSGAIALTGVQVMAVGSVSNGYLAGTLSAMDGSYRFNLPTGDYVIKVVADSYAGPSTLGVLADATTNVAVTVDADLTGINFDLPAGQVLVSGIVQDEAAMPVGGLPLTAVSGEDVFATAVSAVDGSYSVKLAENGSYAIAADQAVAYRLGYISQEKAVTTGTTDLSSQDLAVHSTDTWISGTVTNEASEPLIDLPVTGRSDDNLYNLRMNTAEDGSYLFSLFAGTWLVRAETELQGYTAATGASSMVQPETIDFVAVLDFPPQPPIVDPGGPYQGCLDEPVTLDGSGSTAVTGILVAWNWDLDNDGGYDEVFGETVQNTWSMAGIYPIGLEVVSSESLAATAETTVEIQDCAIICVDDLKAKVKSRKIELAWTSTGTDHYNLYRSTTSGGSYSFIDTTTSDTTIYLDSGLPMGTYYYVVRQANADGEETCQSNEASATLRPRGRQ